MRDIIGDSEMGRQRVNRYRTRCLMNFLFVAAYNLNLSTIYHSILS